jgi:hypothetical protein
VQLNLIKIRFVLFSTRHAQNKPSEIIHTKHTHKKQTFTIDAYYCTVMVKQQSSTHQTSAKKWSEAL